MEGTETVERARAETVRRHDLRLKGESLNHSHHLLPVLPEDAEILAREMAQIQCYIPLFYFEASVEELDDVFLRDEAPFSQYEDHYCRGNRNFSLQF